MSEHNDQPIDYEIGQTFYRVFEQWGGLGWIESRREAYVALREHVSELDVGASGSKNLDWSIVDLGVGSANLAVEPTSVKVESFRPLGDRELPQAKDIRGLFSENKVDINEWSQYVRKG